MRPILFLIKKCIFILSKGEQNFDGVATFMRVFLSLSHSFYHAMQHKGCYDRKEEKKNW